MDGLRIHYLDEGEGQVILCLHPLKLVVRRDLVLAFHSTTVEVVLLCSVRRVRLSLQYQQAGEKAMARFSSSKIGR